MPVITTDAGKSGGLVTVTVPTPSPVTKKPKPKQVQQQVDPQTVAEQANRQQLLTDKPTPQFSTIIPHSGIGIVKQTDEQPQQFSRIQYARKSAGKYGTPSWNPGNPSPEVEEARKTDPLWMYHRGQLEPTYGRHAGQVIMPWNQTLHHQVYYRPGYGGHGETRALSLTQPDYPPPEGFQPHSPYEVPLVSDSEFAHRFRFDPEGFGPAEAIGPHGIQRMGLIGDPPIFEHAINDIHTNRFGRGIEERQDQVLRDIVRWAKKGDPYRIFAASVMGGNRHAIPFLVGHLKARDNPSGWWQGWNALHKSLELGDTRNPERQGNLNPEQVAARLHKIASATADHSHDPNGHQQIAETARSNIRSGENEVHFNPVEKIFRHIVYLLTTWKKMDLNIMPLLYDLNLLT
jgi:hypothetical protein